MAGRDMLTDGKPIPIFGDHYSVHLDGETAGFSNQVVNTYDGEACKAMGKWRRK